MKLWLSKRGGMVVGKTIEWILYLAIAVAAGLVVRSIIIKAGG